MAKVQVVQFPQIAAVKILPDDQLEQVLLWGKQALLLQYSSKLLCGDVAALCLVKVLELRLDKDSLVLDFLSNGEKQVV